MLCRYLKLHGSGCGKSPSTGLRRLSPRQSLYSGHNQRPRGLAADGGGGGGQKRSEPAAASTQLFLTPDISINSPQVNPSLIQRCPPYKIQSILPLEKSVMFRKSVAEINWPQKHQMVGFQSPKTLVNTAVVVRGNTEFRYETFHTFFLYCKHKVQTSLFFIISINIHLFTEFLALRTWIVNGFNYARYITLECPRKLFCYSKCRQFFENIYNFPEIYRNCAKFRDGGIMRKLLITMPWH